MTGVAVTDWSGAAIQINSYDEYGAPAPGNAGRFGYTGQVWLPETGLYHYKNRAYHPELGRFMQTDPIGVNGGMNLYAYVGGDPVNFVDPLGLASICTHWWTFCGGWSRGSTGWRGGNLWGDPDRGGRPRSVNEGAEQGGRTDRPEADEDEEDSDWTDCYDVSGEFSLGASIGASLRTSTLSAGVHLDAGTYRNDVLSGTARVTQGASAQFGLNGVENAFYSASYTRDMPGVVPTDAIDFVYQAHDALSGDYPFAGRDWTSSRQLAAPLEIGASFEFIAGVSFVLKYVC